MATTPKPKTNMFDQDVTSVYDLELPASQDAYASHEIRVETEDEQYMLSKFHEQYVAVEGRAAIGHLVDERIGDLSRHAAFVMGATVETVSEIELRTSAGRFQKHLMNFDDKLVDQTGRVLLETNAIATRTMHEDMRRPIYPPPPLPPPPPPLKKGLIVNAIEFLFGE